jgi:hypothetical protein
MSKINATPNSLQRYDIKTKSGEILRNYDLNDNTSKTPIIKIEWNDQNKDGVAQKKEISGKNLSAEQYKAIAGIIETKQVPQIKQTVDSKNMKRAPSIEVNQNNGGSHSFYEELIISNFGISSKALETKAQSNMNSLTKEADELARKIDPNATSWQDALKGLESQRFKTSQEALANFKITSQETLEYMKKKGFAPPDTKDVNVVEDTNPEGTGAYVDGEKGDFHVETSNPESDVYLPFDAKKTSIHELAHAVDYQENGMSKNPLREGLAYYVEEKAYTAGDFYKTDAEKLQALKWLIIRNARVLVTSKLHKNEMTAEEAKAYLIEKAKMFPQQAKAEVDEMLENPIQKISYVAGAEGIKTLWEKVQEKNPEMTHADFLNKIYDANKESTGKIAEIAEQVFGINLQEKADSTKK